MPYMLTPCFRSIRKGVFLPGACMNSVLNGNCMSSFPRIWKPHALINVMNASIGVISNFVRIGVFLGSGYYVNQASRHDYNFLGGLAG